MNKLRFWLLLSLWICSVAFLSACRDAQAVPLFEQTGASDNASQTTVILLTHSESENSLTQELALKFKQKLESLSGGQMQVDIFPNNTLGNWTDATNSFGNGAVEMRLGVGPSNALAVIQWLPSMQEVDLDQLESSLQEGGAVRKILDEQCAQAGVQILGIMPPLFRVVTSNQPVVSVEDFSKLHMRVFSTGIESSVWEQLGAHTLSFPIEEVYTALQQGIVDAQENTLPSIIGNRLYQQQKYLIMTNHKLYMDLMYIDQEFLQSLTEDQQQFIVSAADDAIQETTALQEEYLTNGYRQFESSGMQIIPFSSQQREKMRNIIGQGVEDYLSETFGSELVQQVKSALT
ncbi:MAG: TRAP transporter substrate-binding protein [Lawsonibacter sp.]